MVRIADDDVIKCGVVGREIESCLGRGNKTNYFHFAKIVSFVVCKHTRGHIKLISYPNKFVSSTFVT
jgi:hypothetical protein